MRPVVFAAVFMLCSFFGTAYSTHDDIRYCQAGDWGWYVVSAQDGPDLVYMTSQHIKDGDEIDMAKIFCALHPETSLLILSKAKEAYVPGTETDNAKS